MTVKPLMKPDVKAFPILKSISDFSKWYADVLALAKAQGIEAVFDHTYVPVGKFDKDLFHYIQSYVYAMLRRTIKPPELWQYVEYYAEESDSQGILIAMVNHVRKSTYSIITLRDNMQTIVNARMVKDWKGSCLEFIIAFDSMMDEYNKCQGRRELRINPHQKRQYLQNAVSGVRGLQDVLDRECDRITMGEAPFSYEQYLVALKSVATRLDDKRKKEGKRFIGWHDMDHTEDTPLIDVNISDSERLELDINEVRRRKSASDFLAQMNRETWNSLAPETQKVWDSLPKEEKIKLLTYSKDRHDRRNAKANITDTTPSMDINNHDISGGGDDEGADSKEDPSSEPDKLEVNTTMWKINNAQQQARSEAHPGDLRRMMGSTSPARASIEAKLHQCISRPDTVDEDSSSDDDSTDFQ